MWLRHDDGRLRASMSDGTYGLYGLVCCVATRSVRKEAVTSVACECEGECD